MTTQLASLPPPLLRPLKSYFQINRVQGARTRSEKERVSQSQDRSSRGRANVGQRAAQRPGSGAVRPRLGSGQRARRPDAADLDPVPVFQHRRDVALEARESLCCSRLCSQIRWPRTGRARRSPASLKPAAKAHLTALMDALADPLETCGLCEVDAEPIAAPLACQAAFGHSARRSRPRRRGRLAANAPKTAERDRPQEDRRECRPPRPCV